MTEPAPLPAPPRPGAVYVIGRAILRPLLAVLFRPRITGRELIPAAGPVLLASNHFSAWDTVLIPVATTRPVQFLTKSELFTATGCRGRFLRWFFTSIGGVPVLRKSGQEARAALDAGADILRRGGVFGVFPEGTRSRDGRLSEGRSGAAWMALQTGAAVVPVGLLGTDTMRWYGRGGRARRVEVRFGPPIDTSDLAELPGGRARATLTARIMDAIAGLSEQERSAAVAPSSRD